MDARIDSGIQYRLHGESAPETLAAWKRYGEAFSQFSDLILRV